MIGRRTIHDSSNRREAWLSTVTLTLIVCLCAPPALAQNAAPGPAVPGAAAAVPPVTQAAVGGRATITVTRTDQPPSIDGRLQEEIWGQAAHITQFVQQRPQEGAPATEQTDVYITYDSDNLYLGIYAHYSDPTLIRGNRADRDQTANDDTVTFFFDPFMDALRGYSLSVNAYGVQRDALIGERDAADKPDGDVTWNALYSSAASLVDDGWIAELAIPFKSLRYPGRADGVQHRWGFQIQREIRGKDERVAWSPVKNGVAGFLPQLGVLEGMTNLSTQRNLEILPTVTALQLGRLNTEDQFVGNPVREAGISLKYGITSNLTFDFTGNPDFSQIESDRPQIEVNQRFPLLYPELRPFFLEGAELFRILGAITYVHTRTIIDPQVGVKLTGKLGKTAVGLVVANDEAPGKVEPGEPGFGKTARALIGRAKYDLYSNSYVGALVTERTFQNGFSRLFLQDGNLRLGASHTFLWRAATTDSLDQQGVHKTGSSFDTSIARESGRGLAWRLIYYQISPDWLSDLSFVNRVDQRRQVANVSYRWWPESWIVNWTPKLNYSQVYSWDGVLTDRQADVGADAEFAHSMTLSTTVSHTMERYRGINFDKNRASFSGTVNSSRRILLTGKIDVGDQIRFIADPFLGRTRVFSLGATVRPISRLQSAINLDTTRFVDPRSNSTAFDVKILHAVTTYQFTDRLLIRDITDFNTLDKTVGANVLITYRINAGTVFFAGYDDRYRRGDLINARFPVEYQRTNRAIFAKVQYLFRR